LANLIYSAITSLDGYVVDASGKFDWAMPSEEVHAFVNDLERPVGTYLYGRRMYETMKAWEHSDTFTADSPVMQDFARIWKAADKIVYSHSLAETATARTRIERAFDPDAVRALKSGATRDISIGGPGIAGQAIEAGLVDECRLFLTPVIVGGGTRSLPDHVRVKLGLLEERRFANGMVYLAYRVER
jgi:dihydrofolate reductase